MSMMWLPELPVERDDKLATLSEVERADVTTPERADGGAELLEKVFDRAVKKEVDEDDDGELILLQSSSTDRLIIVCAKLLLRSSAGTA